jgi:hypothetical protein
LINFIQKYAISIFAAILVSLFFVKDNVIVHTTTQYTAGIAKDSGAVYLSLRGINAALSFVEEIEVNASVIVASGTVQPFKVLKPVDDAVERMSSAIFYIGVMAATITVVLEFFGRYGFLVCGVAMGLQQKTVQSGIISKENFVSCILEGIRNSAGIILIALASFFISSGLSEKLSDNKWLEYRSLLNDISTEVEELAIIDEVKIQEDVSESENPIVEQSEAINLDEKNWKERILDSAENMRDGLLDKGQEVADSVRGVTSTTMNTMVEKYNLASEITAKFWERKDELVEALTAIFALFLFKTFILPLILFLFLYGSLRGVFVRSTI